MIPQKREGWVIQCGIIVFWWLFWLLNVIDKLVTQPRVFWVGENYVDEFVELFGKIGMEGSPVPIVLLMLVTVMELFAFIYLSVALVRFLRRDRKRAHHYLFMGILVSLVVFSFFTIGDQFFGERADLLEHTLYWLAFIISWFAYTHAEG